MIYLIGSLRNPRIPEVGNILRAEGYEVFDDWHAGGQEADDEWMRYEKIRGRHYKDALLAYNAQHIFTYDLLHLNRATVGVLVQPAGKSGHLELGYLIGQNKPGFILFDEEPDRWDVMNAFAAAVCFSVEELLAELRPVLKVAEQRRKSRHAPWSSDL